MFEQIFGNSVVGAVFLGYPYSGVGIIDIAILTILFYIGLKLAFIIRKNTNMNREQDADFPRETGKKTLDAPEDQSEAERPGVPEVRDRPVGQGKPASPPMQPTSQRFGNTQKNDGSGASYPRTVKEQAASAWDHLRSTPAPTFTPPEQLTPGQTLPADFDTEDFLDGARMFFQRLQVSWAARQIDDIAAFVTQEMFEIVSEQAKRDPQPRHVDIMFVNATLTSVTRQDDEETAVVLFSALLREEGRENPIDAREIWHFTRDTKAQSMWKLDAIEQVES